MSATEPTRAYIAVQEPPARRWPERAALCLASLCVEACAAVVALVIAVPLALLVSPLIGNLLMRQYVLECGLALGGIVLLVIGVGFVFSPLMTRPWGLWLSIFRWTRRCGRSEFGCFLVGVELDPPSRARVSARRALEDLGLLTFEDNAIRFDGDKIHWRIPFKHIIYAAQRESAWRQGEWVYQSGYYLKLLTPMDGREAVVFALVEGVTQFRWQRRNGELRENLKPFWLEPNR